MNKTDLDRALLAGAAYGKVRSTNNFVPYPVDAVQLGEGVQTPSGFEAYSNRYDGKIAIAFAGTLFPGSGVFGGTAESTLSQLDWIANVALGVGLASRQIFDGAHYCQNPFRSRIPDRAPRGGVPRGGREMLIPPSTVAKPSAGLPVQ